MPSRWGHVGIARNCTPTLSRLPLFRSVLNAYSRIICRVKIPVKDLGQKKERQESLLYWILLDPYIWKPEFDQRQNIMVFSNSSQLHVHTETHTGGTIK